MEEPKLDRNRMSGGSLLGLTKVHLGEPEKRDMGRPFAKKLVRSIVHPVKALDPKCSTFGVRQCRASYTINLDFRQMRRHNHWANRTRSR